MSHFRISEMELLGGNIGLWRLRPALEMDFKLLAY